VKFLEYSLGSIYELETQVTAVDMLNYGDGELRKQILRDLMKSKK
jgi:hypothetical protein